MDDVSFKATSTLRRGGKYDRAMYYRRPKADRHGQPLEQADWIVIGSRTQLEHMQLRGFEPLFKYGYLPYVDPELREDDGSPAPLRSPWYPILVHRDGPREFPVEQIMVFRWYIPEKCPNPKAKFPQLKGHKIVHYPCPDCRRTPFIGVDGLGGIRDLATHLRLMHNWDRPSILSYGERVGIDFNVVYGDLRQTFEFTAESLEPEPVACDECDWKPSEGKDPAKALRMHKLSHRPLEVETVG